MKRRGFLIGVGAAIASAAAAAVPSVVKTVGQAGADIQATKKKGAYRDPKPTKKFAQVEIWNYVEVHGCPEGANVALVYKNSDRQPHTYVAPKDGVVRIPKKYFHDEEIYLRVRKVGYLPFQLGLGPEESERYRNAHQSILNVVTPPDTMYTEGHLLWCDQDTGEEIRTRPLKDLIPGVSDIWE